jgi:hypothetical protein
MGQPQQTLLPKSLKPPAAALRLRQATPHLSKPFPILPSVRAAPTQKLTPSLSFIPLPKK